MLGAVHTANTSRRWLIGLALVSAGVALLYLPKLTYGAFYSALVYVEAKKHTEYSLEFSQSQFDAIAIGDTGDSVIRRLGDPLRRSPHTLKERLTFSNGLIAVVAPSTGRIDEIRTVSTSDDLQRLLAKSSTYSDLVSRFGVPTQAVPETEAEFWSYSRSDRYSHYFVRSILMSLDEPPKVISKSQYVHYD